MNSISTGFAIGIDVGATNTKIGLVDPLVRIRASSTFPSNIDPRDPSSFLKAVTEVIQPIIANFPVMGIGVSLCSLVNEAHTGALLSVNAPALNNLNLKQVLETRFNCPVQVWNDVVSYAVAEYNCGAGRGVKRLLCLALGTGLAIAAVINGRVIETWGGVSADAARIILDPSASIRCKGNVRGSAEAFCGTQHIERLARIKYGRETVTAREVITASKNGSDPVSGEVMAEIGDHVGHLLAILSPIFFPQRILITGGTAEAGESFYNAIRERYTQLVGDYMSTISILEADESRPVEILKAGLGPEAAIIGSVWGFFNPSG